MPVQGGKAISDIDLGIQGDDTGENISAKNPYYAELTVLYWAWKNLKNVDYIGLCHYRRYFKFSSFPFRNLVICPTDKFPIMKDTDFNPEKYLGKYDIIMIKPIIESHSIDLNYRGYIYWDDLLLLKEVIRDFFPDYYYFYCEILERGNKYFPHLMFITKWEIFNDYCEWLFELLNKMEERLEIKSYSSGANRVLAFMAEAIFPVYVAKNSYKVKKYPIITLDDEKKTTSLRKTITHYFTANLAFRISKPLKYWFRRHPL
jgi:hypothetical protein